LSWGLNALVRLIKAAENLLNSILDIHPQLNPSSEETLRRQNRGEEHLNGTSLSLGWHSTLGHYC
jgi:hypothetical protein